MAALASPVVWCGLSGAIRSESGKGSHEAVALKPSPLATLQARIASRARHANTRQKRHQLHIRSEAAKAAESVSAGSRRVNLKKETSVGIVAGDIGGTNARFTLATINPRSLKDRSSTPDVLLEKVYDTSKYETFSAAFAKFIKEAKKAGGADSAFPVVSCSLAIAGPVINGKVNMTNLGWQLEEEAIAKEFDIPRVRLLNDFAAVGYGVLAVHKEQLFVLNNAQQQVGKPIVCLGPGTGLGVALLTWDNAANDYTVWSSEGGHADFAPRNKLQRALQKYIEETEGFCEIEHVACGKGLERVYKFLVQHHNRQVDNPDLKAPAIGKLAVTEEDETCVEAVDLFLEIIGQVASNLAVTALAYGGVYIAGGIPSKLLERIKNGGLLKAFYNESNPKFTGVLREMPLKVVLDTSVGLVGAREVAIRELISFAEEQQVIPS
eukprot:jgi/Chlat1/7452/Chrsp6S07461